VSVAILGARADMAAQMLNGWFVARASGTLAVAVASAIVAFLVSVPGLESSRSMRALPVTACVVWAAMLVGAIAATPSPLDVLLRVAPHPSCAVLIAATAFVPAVLLVRMLRHAVPLHTRWTAGLAGLASLGMGALGTQFVCTNDAAAHHLLWHFTPVVLLALASAVAGSSVLGWSLADRSEIARDD
jgi:hypothetical protein